MTSSAEVVAAVDVLPHQLLLLLVVLLLVR